MSNKKEEIYFLPKLQAIPNSYTVRSWSIYFNDQKLFRSIIKNNAANFPKKLRKLYLRNSFARKFKGWWIGTNFDIYLNRVKKNFGPLTVNDINRICEDTSTFFVIYTAEQPYYEEDVWQSLSVEDHAAPAIWIEAIDKEDKPILTYFASDPTKESLDDFLSAYNITCGKDSYHLSFIVQSEDICEGFDVMDADILKKCCQGGKIVVKIFYK